MTESNVFVNISAVNHDFSMYCPMTITLFNVSIFLTESYFTNLIVGYSSDKISITKFVPTTTK